MYKDVSGTKLYMKYFGDKLLTEFMDVVKKLRHDEVAWQLQSRMRCQGLVSPKS